MKTTKITKAQAITIMINILREGCAIPMVSIGNGGSRYRFVGPILMVKDILWYVSRFKDMTFRVVPTSEYSDGFSGRNLTCYDVCVEFTSNDGDFSEQFFLWNLDYFKE